MRRSSSTGLARLSSLRPGSLNLKALRLAVSDSIHHTLRSPQVHPICVGEEVAALSVALPQQPPVRSSVVDEEDITQEGGPSTPIVVEGKATHNGREFAEALAPCGADVEGEDDEIVFYKKQPANELDPAVLREVCLLKIADELDRRGSVVDSCLMDETLVLDMLETQIPPHLWTPMSAAKVFQKLVDEKLATGASLLAWSGGRPARDPATGDIVGSFRSYCMLEAEYERNPEVFNEHSVWNLFWPAAKTWLLGRHKQNYEILPDGVLRVHVEEGECDGVLGESSPSPYVDVKLETEDQQLAMVYALSYDCHSSWRTPRVNEQRYLVLRAFVEAGVLSRAALTAWVDRGLGFGRSILAVVDEILSADGVA
eukprot:jgi/Chlat1/1984/Chrsp158S02311